MAAAAFAALMAGCAAPPTPHEDRGPQAPAAQIPREPVVPLDFEPQALAAQMQREPVVLLGEIHDNGPQHRTGAQALALLLHAGLRPALAFEQFDRERQVDIDRVLSDQSADDDNRVGRLVALGARGWDWKLYRPFLKFAIEYRLPVVAANLSRADAMRVSKQGFGAMFDVAEQRQLGLDPLPSDLLLVQQKEVDEGHCHQINQQMLPALARAQIARDAALALAIRPYLQRGVILLTGNGHARRDIGVPHFLSPEERKRLVSIGLIERDTPVDTIPAGAYDAVFRTPVQSRADPCEALKHKTQARKTDAAVAR